MTKPVGGRGKKAPYETVVMRVPKALESTIERMCDEYREMIATDSPASYLLGTYHRYLNIGELLNRATEILKQKKSAKYSILKLLQVLFPKADVKESDLKL